MNTVIPAKIGMSLRDVDTPALLIDLDNLERNISVLAAYCNEQKIDLRAHAKTHKSVEIAKLQIRHGAVGICCQKVSEAEVFVQNGIKDILITNQVLGELKITRLAGLAKKSKMGVCVDDPANVEELNRIAAEQDVHLTILIELDVGGGRCGIRSKQTLNLMANKIANASHLVFGGLQAYHGGAQHIYDYRLRRQAIEHAVSKVSACSRWLLSHGFSCRSITGGGTGTYPFETGSGLYTELQCGSYVFMDADYGKIRMENKQIITTFENSLFVLTTVMSKTNAKRAICDAGLKAHSIDSGPPLVREARSVEYIASSDEHTILHDPENILRLGDKLLLVPGHCDPTVNMHNWYIGIRKDRVEQLWPVSARGMLT